MTAVPRDEDALFALAEDLVRASITGELTDQLVAYTPFTEGMPPIDAFAIVEILASALGCSIVNTQGLSDTAEHRDALLAAAVEAVHLARQRRCSR